MTCKTKDTLTLQELTPLQGDLKVRTTKDLDLLQQDLQDKGQLTPFIIWKSSDQPSKNYILDGHGRFQAYIRMAMEQPSLLTQPLPVVYIDAPDLQTARELLLHIDSRYGKISKVGLENYLKIIPTVNLSSLQLLAPKTQLPKPKVAPLVAPEPQIETHSIIKLKVPKEQEAQLLSVLKTCSFVEVL